MNNTIKRGLSGIGFVLIMIACMLVNEWLFAGLMVFIMICMMVEFYRMTLEKDYPFSRVLAIVSGATIFVVAFLVNAYGINFKYICVAALPLLLVMTNALYTKERMEMWKFSIIYTGIFYIAAPLAMTNILVFDHGQFNGMLLLCFFIIIWSSDVGAYMFGITLGQKFGKKLFPSISPKKSWIGAFGGFLMAILAAVILKLAGVLEFPMVHCIILAAIMDVTGVYGDLFESMWKRYYDVKDSGNIIPGHGGMLDRFDSSLTAIPGGILYLVLLNLL